MSLMSFKKSSEILQVFPCVNRTNIESKLMSEGNITNILKSITDKESYIISWEDTTLRCVIKGYYFEIEESPEGDKYAHLQMNSDGTLLDGDVDEQFKGLKINNESQAADLILCVGGNIPTDSKIKFTQKSLKINTIDCGELN